MGTRVAHLFSLLCCPIVCIYVLSSVWWFPLLFPHRKEVRFVFKRARVLFTLFVFVYVQWCPTHIVLCFCCFSLFLCTISCQFLWIVNFWFPIRYFLTFVLQRLLVSSNLLEVVCISRFKTTFSDPIKYNFFLPVGI